MFTYAGIFWNLQALATYLTFCGIAIHNAQIFEAYSKEYERNKVFNAIIMNIVQILLRELMLEKLQTCEKRSIHVL